MNSVQRLWLPFLPLTLCSGEKWCRRIQLLSPTYLQHCTARLCPSFTWEQNVVDIYVFTQWKGTDVIWSFRPELWLWYFPEFWTAITPILNWINNCKLWTDFDIKDFTLSILVTGDKNIQNSRRIWSQICFKNWCNCVVFPSPQWICATKTNSFPLWDCQQTSAEEE